jgi:DNA (cytosine-5)-methyltransferase 1
MFQSMTRRSRCSPPSREKEPLVAYRRETLTVLSAFSGLGGLDLGLEAANFKHVGCIEKDEVARRSLKANRGADFPLLEPGDISTLVHTLTPEQLGLQRRQLSMLAGGPPWSMSARVGLEDGRSRCLHDFLALIDLFLPRVVLVENVSGFVRGSVSALDEIQSRLESINTSNATRYTADHRILNAADYGVPQYRYRAIIVMTRDGERLAWPKPTHVEQPIRAWDAIGDLRNPDSPPQAAGKWAELLPSIPEGKNYLWHTSQGGGRPLFGYRTRFWSFLLKLAKDQPSWTLPAQPGPSTGPFHWDNRPLTIPEMLRLQSFPADWSVEGDHRGQIRQVGNATPPRLAEILGRAIATQLFDACFSGRRLRYHVARRATVPTPAPTVDVPKKYRYLVGQHKDHPGPGKGPRPRSPKSATTNVTISP